MVSDQSLQMRAEQQERLRAMSDQRGIKIFQILTASIEPRRLSRIALAHPMAKAGLGGAAIELIQGLAWNFAIVGTAATVSGVFFGVLGSEIPIVGTAAGVEFGVMLGASCANCILLGVGLVTSTQLVGYVMGLASVPFEAGSRIWWNNGRTEDAAEKFAEAWVELAFALLPIILMLVIHKGYNAINKRVASFTRLNSLLQDLPKSVSNLASVKLAGKCGFGFAEFQGMKAMSIGRFIIVRAGNKARLRYIGKELEAKGIEVKGKTIRQGEYSGAIAFNEPDFKKAEKVYIMTDLGNGRTQLRLKPGAPPHDPGQGVLGNQFDGWTFERIRPPGSDEVRFLLRDPEGRVATGDIDRLVNQNWKAMEFDNSGTPTHNPTIKPYLENAGIVADDPAEIRWWNEWFNKYVPRGSRVTRDTAKHGPSHTFIDPQSGLSRYQADSHETVLLFTNGQAFELSWNQMVDLLRINKSLGTNEVFQEVLNVK